VSDRRGKEELTAILTELLEAERSGVWVTHKSALTARDSAGGADAGDRKGRSTLVMLAGHLRMLGQPPSSKIGAFYEKAMAISDFGELIGFLNRGQSRVLRKPRELLPRVRDNSMPISAKCCGRTRRTSRLPLTCPDQPHRTPS
jgi:hypothetical protein